MSNFRETANPYKGRNPGTNRHPKPHEGNKEREQISEPKEGKNTDWEQHRTGSQQQRPKYGDARPARSANLTGSVEDRSSGTPHTGTIPSRYTDPDTADASHRTAALNDPHTNRAKKFKGFGHGGDLLQQKAVAAKLRGG